MARLLFDQNLSYRLSALLADLFPESVHAREVGLTRADDLSVWRYASAQALTIVTKDSDFNQMSFLHGPPPKVVWLRTGNCSTREILALIRRDASEIVDFADFAEEGLMIIGEVD
jgi:predicted nuclease of predicted toxin-antitoxin system